MSAGSINRLSGPDHREKLTAQNFNGIVVPLLTPYREDYQQPKVDIDSLRVLVETIQPDVDGIFPAGNAGEGPSLDVANYRTLLRTVVETRDRHFIKNIPIIAGVLKKDPEEIIQFCHTAEESGVDGIIIAPMFGGHNPERVIETVLSVTNLPVALYSNPGMHGDKELPVEIIRSAKDSYPNRVIGIKSSSKNFSTFEKISKLKSETFKVFQGHTAYAAESLEMGADGIVPVEANMSPEIFRSLYVNSKNHSTMFERRKEDVELLLSRLQKERAKLSMGSAQIVKHFLVKQGIFKSSRMYQG